MGVDRRALGYRNKIYQVAKSSRRSLRRAVALHRPDWRDGWTAAVSAFQAFEVPLVELPRVDDADSESIGRVCAIFEKLNSTGVDLGLRPPDCTPENSKNATPSKPGQIKVSSKPGEVHVNRKWCLT